MLSSISQVVPHCNFLPLKYLLFNEDGKSLACFILKKRVISKSWPAVVYDNNYHEIKKRWTINKAKASHGSFLDHMVFFFTWFFTWFFYGSFFYFMINVTMAHHRRNISKFPIFIRGHNIFKKRSSNVYCC